MADSQRIEDLFHRALELPEVEREAFVRSEAGEDDVLIGDVLSLLSHDKGANAFGLLNTTALSLVGEQVGDRMGSYELLELVGEGGFGSVYRARQHEPVRREVALKLIKLGMDTRRVTARFEAERQALASMDHPHIARAFDAGTTESGRAYFAMEFVPGEPITTYCDKHRLTIDARLEVFRQVCSAVEHAHQKAILHRDIKPSNVLVQTVDGAPFVKVIDFGIAKALSDADVGPGVTQEGLPIGTPHYMSPEQALGKWSSVDTRSDVYALGVLLYELLTGSLPVEPSDLSTLEEVRRSIDAPTARPSVRARTRMREIAVARGTDQSTLMRRLRGDLDWIVLKAIEKEQGRRYSSVAELSADIERHQKSLPISAAAPTLRYRAEKFVRRHRVGVGVAAVVSLAVMGGVVGTGIGFARAVDAERAALELADEEAAARRLAERRFEQVRGIGRSLIYEIRDAIADVPGGTEAQRLVVDTGLEYLEALAREAAGNEELLREVATGYLRLSQVLGAPHRQNMGDTAGAVECLERAAELLHSIENAERNSEVLRSLGQVYRDLGNLLLAMGRTEEAAEQVERSVGFIERAAALDPAMDLGEEIAIGRANLGRIQQTLGRHAEAVEAYHAYIEFAMLADEDDPDFPIKRRNIAMLWGRVAELRVQMGESEQALEDLIRAEHLLGEILVHSPENTLILGTVQQLSIMRGQLLSEMDRLDEALASFVRVHELAEMRAVADPTDQNAQRALATSEFWLGMIHKHRGEYAASLEHSREYLRQVESLIERNPEYAVLQRDRIIALNRLANALSANGAHEEGVERGFEAVRAVDALSAANPQDASLRLDRLNLRRDLAAILLEWAELLEGEEAVAMAWWPARGLLSESLELVEELRVDGILPQIDAEADVWVKEQLVRCEAVIGGGG